MPFVAWRIFCQESFPAKETFGKLIYRVPFFYLAGYIVQRQATGCDAILEQADTRSWRKVTATYTWRGWRKKRKLLPRHSPRAQSCTDLTMGKQQESTSEGSAGALPKTQKNNAEQESELALHERGRHVESMHSGADRLLTLYFPAFFISSFSKKKKEEECLEWRTDRGEQTVQTTETRMEKLLTSLESPVFG